MHRNGIVWPKAIIAAYLVGMALLTLAGCAKTPSVPPPVKPSDRVTTKPYTVFGKTYYPLPNADGFKETGVASWYGGHFHGRRTSNGEVYDMESMTAAHKLLPFGTYVQVTNTANGKSTVVRINDRGPFVANRVIDLSKAAAREIDMIGPGTASVEVLALGYREDQLPGGQIPSPSSAPWGPFTVQVGAFTQESNAWRLAASLRAKYGEVNVVNYDRGDQRFYRVRVGKEQDLNKAQNLEASLRSSGFEQAFLVAW